MFPRTLLSLIVWLSASGAAWWLARSDSGLADAPAQIVPREHRIAAAETARIVELRVLPGQQVKAGDLLARLDSSVLEREIGVAEARLRQLGSTPAASAATMESDGYASERGFQSDVDEASTQLAAARAEQAQQAAELASLRQEIARQRQLVREGLTRADRAEELEVRARSLADAARAWPARLDALNARHHDARNRLEEWRGQHKSSSAPRSREARLKPLREAIDEQREALRVLRARLAAANIVAPAGGEVVTVLARPGDVATAGVPLLILHGAGPRLLVAYVNERASLAPGAKAVARRRTPLREEIPAAVARVSDTVVQLPPRFWLLPTIPQWGREVFLEIPADTHLDGGEALDVRFLSGGLP